MSKAPKLLLLWLATALSLVGFVAGFDFVVDPFGYFGTNSLGYYFSSERQFKFSIVKGYDYNAIMLGDSRIAFTDPSYVNRSGYRFVNGGIAGASIAELVALLSASQLEHLRLAVFGLTYGDLGSCNDDKVAGYGSWNLLRFAASWTQFHFAIATLKAHAKDLDPRYHADGTRSIVAKAFKESTLDGKNQRYWSKIEAKAGGNSTPHFELGAKCRELLSEARALSDRYGFALVVVFLPRDRDMLRRMYADTPQMREQVETFLAQVREVVPHVVDLTDSTFSDSTNFWLDDPLHFKPEVGARVLEEAIRHTFDTPASK
jgi:hypothetical protein